MGPSVTRGPKQSIPLNSFFFAAVAILMGMGLTMVLSASGIKAEQLFGDPYHFFRKQALFLVLSLVIIFGSSQISIGFVFKTVYIWLGLTIILLALTLSPWGYEAGGAQRWLRVGPYSFQPLELVKVALVLYLAYFFSQKQDKIKSFYIGFLPPALITCLLVGLLILQPDFGGAVFLMILFFLMSLVGGVRLIYLLTMFLFSSLAGAVLIISCPYRWERFLASINPFQHASDSGYQIVQSLYALAMGGLWGKGLGEGQQKLFFLPEAHTDFIMAVLGEELGFVGISIIFLCFGYILFRMFAFLVSSKDIQRQLAGFGLTMVLVTGFFLHTAVVLGAIPPKGLALPFLSYGGSSLVGSSLSVGLILGITGYKRGTS